MTERKTATKKGKAPTSFRKKVMDTSWEAIFEAYDIDEHDFDVSPYTINADQIKSATSHFKKTGEKEARLLCKQDTRESRPKMFRDRGLFILPTKNGEYIILKGEGYVDIPVITGATETYYSKLDFHLETLWVGNSEMQHVDFAYASSLVRTFMEDSSLVLTIRGRKYTPPFSFHVGPHEVSTESVQTEIDAGYEGKKQIVLVEAKNSNADNVIIRQLYYPYRQWTEAATKPVKTLFFAKYGNEYKIWLYEFADPEDYNSVRLVKSETFIIANPPL